MCIPLRLLVLLLFCTIYTINAQDAFILSTSALSPPLTAEVHYGLAVYYNASDLARQQQLRPNYNTTYLAMVGEWSVANDDNNNVIEAPELVISVWRFFPSNNSFSLVGYSFDEIFCESIPGISFDLLRYHCNVSKLVYTFIEEEDDNTHFFYFFGVHFVSPYDNAFRLRNASSILTLPYESNPNDLPALANVWNVTVRPPYVYRNAIHTQIQTSSHPGARPYLRILMGPSLDYSLVPPSPSISPAPWSWETYLKLDQFHLYLIVGSISVLMCIMTALASCCCRKRFCRCYSFCCCRQSKSASSSSKNQQQQQTMDVFIDESLQLEATSSLSSQSRDGVESMRLSSRTGRFFKQLFQCNHRSCCCCCRPRPFMYELTFFNKDSNEESTAVVRKVDYTITTTFSEEEAVVAAGDNNSRRIVTPIYEEEEEKVVVEDKPESVTTGAAHRRKTNTDQATSLTFSATTRQGSTPSSSSSFTNGLEEIIEEDAIATVAAAAVAPDEEQTGFIPQ